MLTWEYPPRVVGGIARVVHDLSHRLIKDGHEVVVGHGNGPQVGMIVNSFGNEEVVKKNQFNMPFPEAGGMSQGYIGYHMQNAIASEMKRQGLNIPVQYILTQTLVDADDPAFKNPTKPVGPFYKDEASAKAANPGSVVVEDAGRGYRKVVASPKPIGFLGLEGIKKSIDARKKNDIFFNNQEI